MGNNLVFSGDADQVAVGAMAMPGQQQGSWVSRLPSLEETQAMASLMPNRFG